MHPLVIKVLERLHWLVQYREKRIAFYWIPSHVGIGDDGNADAADKPGLMGRETHIPMESSSLLTDARSGFQKKKHNRLPFRF